MKFSITESQLKKLTKKLSEDLEYNHVDDASPENDDYQIGEDEVDEGSRTLARTRKKSGDYVEPK